MNKIGMVSRSFTFMSLSQASCPRFERRIGLTKVVLLLIFALTLASCLPSNESASSLALSETSSRAPTVTAPASITVAATNAGGTATADPTITSFLNGANAFDEVDGVIATIINDAPAVFPLGTNTVTFSATDNYGNTGTAQATVTVADQTAPVTTMLGLSSITLEVGSIFIDPGATASDNVDGDLTPAIVSGGNVITGVAGLYTLTYDVSDTVGNAAAQMTRGVSVQDSGAPVVTPSTNITVVATDASGTAASDPAIVAFLVGASAIDAVDGPIATITNDAPTQFPLGVTTVTFSATDGSSNTGQAQATVTVSDQTAPIVTAPANITVAATGPGGIAVTEPAIVAFLGGASATDNVDGPIVTISNNAAALLLVGVTTVTFSAIDSAGNTGTAQATVTVTAPVVLLQKIAFSRDVGGQLDLFAIAEDGTGGLVTLANDPGDEVFGGSTSDNRVIYVRDTGGGLNDIYSINDDGSGIPIMLTTDARDELPVAVTAANEVIFMRSTVTPPDSDLLSINSDGSGGEVSLAVTADIEFFGGLTFDGRVVYDRIDAGLTQSDVYSILTDGSGGTVPLAVTGDFEAGGGIAAGTLVIFARSTAFGQPNDIFTIDADGLSLESTLVATPGVDELPVDVTASDLVIFMRTTGTVFNLLSICASGTPAEAQLASADLGAFELISYEGSTGGRVIYNICNFLTRNCDIFSRNADGSGVEATLAGDPDPLLIEAFAGVSSDGLVIIVRDDGTNTELISINADGTGVETSLVTTPTPVPPGEVFKGVTTNGRLIFERDVGGQTNLYSIKADGSALEVPLATAATDETFGGIF
jgi:hypothetical protein